LDSNGSTANPLKRTPLYEQHVAAGAKMVPFAGWEMPLRYAGFIKEHKVVRQAAGLFDVSHMGEILVSGPQAEQALEYLTCNRVGALCDGKAQYSAITNPQGGVVDDIIVYRINKTKFLLCVNAANTNKDFLWLTERNRFYANIANKSSSYGQIALQGPKSLEILAKVYPKITSQELRYFHFVKVELVGAPVMIARTGYTGEDGFEFFVPTDATAALWQALLEVGVPLGLKPVGLGARDSLRLEVCYPLHGHELGEDISAIESGVGWIVKLKKGDFVGRERLVLHKTQGAPRALAGFFVEDLGIAREGAIVFNEQGHEIGVVTSGTKTPTINRALGLALIKSEFAVPGTGLLLAVRKKKLKARVVERPFYMREPK